MPRFDNTAIVKDILESDKNILRKERETFQYKLELSNDKILSLSKENERLKARLQSNGWADCFITFGSLSVGGLGASGRGWFIEHDITEIFSIVFGFSFAATICGLLIKYINFERRRN